MYEPGGTLTDGCAGYLHWVQGEYQASIAAWDSAASMHPNNVAVLYRLGQAYAVTQRVSPVSATLCIAGFLNRCMLVPVG